MTRLCVGKLYELFTGSEVSEYFWKCGGFCPAAVRQDEAGHHGKCMSRTVLDQLRAQLGWSPSFDSDISYRERALLFLGLLCFHFP